MVFSSVVFLWVLLPLILGCYFISPGFLKNGLLMVFSLFFYAWGEPRYIVVMLFSVLLNYVFGLWIERCGLRCKDTDDGKGRSAEEETGDMAFGSLRSEKEETGESEARRKHRKIRRKQQWLLAVCVALNLLILGYFKYYNFAADTVNSLSSAWGGRAELLPAVNVALPIGISFYTFQALSYVADVYRGENRAQKNPVNMMLYISFFPQLIAGPIVKYHDIEQQMENRRVTAEGFSYGVKRFIFGLGKKVILANSFAEVVDTVWGYQAQDVSAPLLWMTALLYMMQIYFDFSGYSDMAIGLGKMFGFTFNENFLLPYTAASVRDFWRKWHISLSGWFREYVYIPLGGNRKGMVRTYVNLGTVFLLTGIWHGAGWTFVLWGLYHGFFQVAERMIDRIREGFMGRNPAASKQNMALSGQGMQISGRKRAESVGRTGVAGGIFRRILLHAYTLLVVYFGWILFRAETISLAGEFIRYMFIPHESMITLERFMNVKMWVLLGIAAAASGPAQWFWRKIRGCSFAADGEVTVPALAGYMAIFWVSILLLVNNTYNPFIYFRF